MAHALRHSHMVVLLLVRRRRIGNTVIRVRDVAQIDNVKLLP